MPRLRKPTSAIDTLVFIKKAVGTAQSDNQNGGSFLSQEILDRAINFIPILEERLGDISQLQGNSQKEIREKNQANSSLKTYVRDIWEVLRRRVYREALPLDVFAYYQLPKSGVNPALTNDGQWLEMASMIIKGEEEALKAGYKPVLNPSVAELKDKLITATKENSDVASADKALDEAQEMVSDLIPESKEIIDRIIAELNFNLYKKDPASKRRIMRNYGVRFEVTKNEVSENESDILLN
jgi:hypothetical protein